MNKIFKVLIVFVLSLCSFKVYAVDQLNLCEESDEFKAWKKLSDEEKAKVEFPGVCKISKEASIINSITSNSLANIKAETFPSSYSMWTRGETNYVKHQQTTGTCWTFSSNETVETFMKKNKNAVFDLSELHMEYATQRNFTDGTNYEGHKRTIDQGGNFFMSTAYYMSNRGPVIENDFPFTTNLSLVPLSRIRKNPVVDVNDMMFLINLDTCNSQTKEAIKSHIVNYGAVATTIMMDQHNEKYYNKTTSAYYYNGGTTINHGVTIVGWDDNYAASNFSASNRPPGPGAWIAKNSYGTSFGISGYFFISYYDTTVCRMLEGTSDADTDFPDNLYTYNTLGYNTSSSDVGATTGYSASTFNKSSSKELLTEVSFGAYNYAKIDAYLIPDGTTLSMNNSKIVKLGTLTIPYGGYKTLKLSTPIELKDTKFSIIGKYTYQSTSGVAFGIDYEGTAWEILSTERGQSFISYDGNRFTDLKDAYGGSVTAAIYAGTKNAVVELASSSSSASIYTNKTSTAAYNITTSQIDNNQTLNIKITDKNGTDKTSQFTVTGNTVNSDAAALRIAAKSTTPTGSYNVEVKYDTKKINLNLNVETYVYVTGILMETTNVNLNSSLTLLPVIQPSNAINKSVTYQVTDTSIAKIEGGKVIGLKEGSTTLKIIALDGSGINKSVNLIVTNILKSSSRYQINDNYIINVSENTNYQTFMTNINNSDNKVEIYNTSNAKVTNGIMGTGYKVKKNVNGSIISYDVVVLGDINGDGKIDSADMLVLRRHLMKITELKDSKYISADPNKDSKIDSADMLALRRHLLGIKRIG